MPHFELIISQNSLDGGFYEPLTAGEAFVILFIGWTKLVGRVRSCIFFGGDDCCEYCCWEGNFVGFAQEEYNVH